MSANQVTSPTLVSNQGEPLGDLPAYHAAHSPGRKAIITEAESLDWAELNARANRRARAFAAEGVVQGDYVTIALRNGLEFYETSFAAWKLGAIPNVVSYNLPDAELSAIVDLVDPRLVIGVDPLRLPGRRVRPTGAPIDLSLSGEALPSVVAPHWKAMTSGGSTGRPKVIVDQMPGRWDPKVPTLGQLPGDVILNPGPLYHNAPFAGIHVGLFVGATVVEMGKFDAERALRLMDQHRVTWVNMVPTMMNRIWRLDPDIRKQVDLSALRILFHMAAPCPPWLKEAFIEWLGPERVYELYAGTERQGATIISGTEWLERRGSVGRVQAGARLRVLNDQGQDCAPGEVGEVYFLPDEGRNSSYFYIGAEAKAQNDWESLGDLGWLDADGYLYLSDRRKDLIISGGANIYPAEVEAALEAHADVVNAVAVGLADEDLGERVHAIVQLEPHSNLQSEALLAFAGARLARYKLPRSIEFTKEPLRDEAGKVRRSLLKDLRTTGAEVV